MFSAHNLSHFSHTSAPRTSVKEFSHIDDHQDCSNSHEHMRQAIQDPSKQSVLDDGPKVVVAAILAEPLELAPVQRSGTRF
jgi:hypothetical protein